MTALEIFAIILAAGGIIGSVAPGLPGPPLSWIGLLLIFIGGGCSTTALLVWLLVTIVVSVLDYVVPSWLTKTSGGHKAASWGAVIGLFAGMILSPIGMVTGSLLGAFLGELLVEGSSTWTSVKAAFGAFLGFILGTGLKLIVSGILFVVILKAAL